MADIKYLISVDATGATTSIKQFDETVDGLAKQSAAANRGVGDLAKGVFAGQVAFEAARKIYGTFVDLVHDSKDQFLAAEDADNKLNATLSNMGVLTDDNVKRLGDFARGMQKVTTVDDDTTKSLMALGMRMGISIDQIQDATKGAVGLSKSFGVDLNTAMKLVSQATEGEFAMMGRYIPQLRTTEDVTEKMALATKAMADGFKIAEAEVKTTGGQLTQTQNRVNDTKESIGQLAVRFETLTMRALEPAVNMLADFCRWLDQTDQKAAKDDLGKRWQQNKDAFEAAAKGAGILAEEQAKLFEEHGNISKTERGIAIYAERLDDLIAKHPKAAKAFNEYYKAQHQASAANTAMTLTTGAVAKELEKQRKAEEERTKAGKKAREEQDKERKSAQAMAQSLKKLALDEVDLAKTNKTILEPSIEGATQELINMDEAIDAVNANAKKSFAYMAGVVQDFWDKYGQAAQDAIYAVDAVVIQSHRNKEISLDNEYKKDVERIEQGKMNEEEKAAALAALDEEYDGKRSALKAKQAKQDKLMSIVQATISTYEGAAKAFAQGGIFGHIFGAIIIAAGLALVAKIKSQPIPLAKGAIFKQPTLLGGANGGSYQVAEPGSGGVEIVATPENIRKAIGLDRQRGGGGGGTIVIQNRIFLDGKEMKGWMAKVIEETSRIGKLKVAGKAIVGSA
jgi:ABC-type transporter Mla subunit MlaD